MVNGKYASSNLGELTRKVLQTKGYGMADFAPYAPSNGDPAAFIAQPVVHDGEVEMVVADMKAADLAEARRGTETFFRHLRRPELYASWVRES